MTDETDQVWCPRCEVRLKTQDQEVRVEFSPCGATLYPDGTFQWGALGETFMDYWHMECGTKCRLSLAGMWDEEQQAWLLSPGAMLEVDYADGRPADVLSNPDLTETTVWTETLATLMTILVAALGDLRLVKEA
jgi:hypothetical protein